MHFEQASIKIKTTSNDYFAHILEGHPMDIFEPLSAIISIDSDSSIRSLSENLFSPLELDPEEINFINNFRRDLLKIIEENSETIVDQFAKLEDGPKNLDGKDIIDFANTTLPQIESHQYTIFRT